MVLHHQALLWCLSGKTAATPFRPPPCLGTASCAWYRTGTLATLFWHMADAACQDEWMFSLMVLLNIKLLVLILSDLPSVLASRDEWTWLRQKVQCLVLLSCLT